MDKPHLWYDGWSGQWCCAREVRGQTPVVTWPMGQARTKEGAYQVLIGIERLEAENAMLA